MHFTERLGGAPISWGVCEVPGWGHELPRDRVLDEMRQLSLVGTELGSVGYLPSDAAELRDLVEQYGLGLIGGFVPVVVHDPDEVDATISQTEEIAKLFRDAGATMFISAAVMSWDWGPRHPLDDEAWAHAATMFGRIDEIVVDHGLTQALHPHVGTLVESRDDVIQVLDRTEIGWTLDTGHLQIGGMKPVEFIERAFDRITHVHLKDVVMDLAEPVVAGEQSIMEGVQNGMFCNLGVGDIDIEGSIRELEARGYDGWYVIEQDAAITTAVPEVGEGPMHDVKASIDFLREVDVAPRSESGDKNTSKPNPNPEEGK